MNGWWVGRWCCGADLSSSAVQDWRRAITSQKPSAASYVASCSDREQGQVVWGSRGAGCSGCVELSWSCRVAGRQEEELFEGKQVQDREGRLLSFCAFCSFFGPVRWVMDLIIHQPKGRVLAPRADWWLRGWRAGYGSLSTVAPLD